MALAAVCLDLFGTLVVAGDEEAAWDHWLDLLLVEVSASGADLDRAELCTRCADLFTRPEPEDDGRGLSVYERRLARLLLEAGGRPTVDRVRRAAEITATAWQRRFTVDPEAAAVLAGLAARVPLVLVSNFDHPPTARTALRESGLEGLFSEVAISGEMGVKKPDPEIFRGPLGRLRVDPRAAVHVGDAEEDVHGALAAGLRAVLLRRPGTLAAVPGGAGATVIGSLRELPGVLGGT